MLLTLTIAPLRPRSIAQRANARAALSGPDDVDGEEALGLGRLRVDQRQNGKMGGVVDEDVDRAEPIDGRRDHPLAVGRLGDVGLDRQNRRSAHLLDRRRRARKRLPGPAGDGDPGAFAREGARDPIADPRAAAGHDRDLSGKFPGL